VTTGEHFADDARRGVAALARPSARREKRLPGEEGIWVFVLGDMTVFALFFGTLIYTRAEDPEVFRHGQESLSLGLGVLNTLLLLTSSLLVVLALHDVRSGHGGAGGRSAKLLAGALACGLGFAAVKGVEYSTKFSDGISPSTDDFYTYYFMFTGIHLLHVLIGCVVLWALIRIARRDGADPAGHRHMESGATFWHMVDLLWVVLFPLFYLTH